MIRFEDDTRESGSNADACRYDDEEYTDCAKMAGLMVCPVVMRDRFERIMLPYAGDGYI